MKHGKKSNIELPKGWIKTKLGKICKFEYGKSLKQQNRNEEGKFPVYGSSGILGSHDKYIVKGPCIIVGRKGAAGAVHFSYSECWPIDTTYFIRSIEDLNIKYLYYQLLNLNLPSLEKSTAIPGLTRNDAYEKHFNLAPLNEQNRIVLKLEELLSQLENAKTHLETALGQLKIYRQLLLKLAIEGKFTQNWREEQKSLPHAIKLLEGIKKEREKNTKENDEKPKSIRKLSKEEISSLPKIPKGWIWCRNEELLDYVTSGSRDWKKYYSNSGSLFIRTQDIKTNSLVSGNIARVKLPKNAEGKRSLVEMNDLLMTITGANVGKVALIDKEIRDAYVSQSVALMKYIDKRISPYQYYYFQARGYGGTFIEKMVYGVGRQVLSLENMKDVPVCICSIREQNKIVQELQSRLSACDKLEGSIFYSIKKVESLKQSILQKAFEGKLVEQIPNEESAEALFEKIKKEIEFFIRDEKIKKRNTTRTLKLNDMAEHLKTIMQLLQKNKGPLSTKSVWKSSEHAENIDAFYAKLKEHIDKGEIKELPRKGKESFLKLTTEK